MGIRRFKGLRMLVMVRLTLLIIQSRDGDQFHPVADILFPGICIHLTGSRSRLLKELIPM